MKLSPWIDIDHCSTRVIEGTDPNVIKNRFALIEKTPRVRIKTNQFCIEDKIGGREASEDIWVYGKKGCGQLCGKDPESREWCDKMLVLLGHELS